MKIAHRLGEQFRDHYASHHNDGDVPMKFKRPLIVSFVIGLMAGSGAIFGLQAAAVPPTYVVVEANEITDVQAFKDGYVKMGPAAVAEAKMADGRYLVRTADVTALDGDPPKYFVLIAFQNIDKAKAYHASMKELTATRLKFAKSRSFLVEGLPPRSP